MNPFEAVLENWSPFLKKKKKTVVVGLGVRTGQEIVPLTHPGQRPNHKTFPRLTARTINS
jgi:hypothetical protein